MLLFTFCYNADDDANAKDSGLGTSPRPSFEASENDENESSDCYGIMVSTCVFRQCKAVIVSD